MPTVTGEEIERVVQHILHAAGAPDEHARTVAQHLADNNLAGHDSHGLIRVIQYVRQIKEGAIVPDATPVIATETPTTAQVDGLRSFGQVAAKFAIQVAIEKVKQAGVSCVTIRNLGHLGRLGAYAEMAATAGFAAIIYCCGGGLGLCQVPFGGRERRLSTNPIAMSFPSNLESPILLDIATSVVAEGKLRIYKASGHRIPDGWVLDSEGRSSNDPNDFYNGGALLPLGGSEGHKGYTLAFMAEIFGGILSGGSFAGSEGEHFSNNSLIVAMDVERFAPLETVKAKVSRMTERMKDTPLAEGSKGILYPGEKEVTTRLERQAKGVDIENATWEQVITLIREYALEGTVGPLP
jgi:uncharacterized oxidoreductase